MLRGVSGSIALGRTVLVISIILTIGAVGLGAPDDGLDLFERRIRPLLVEKCYKCHSTEADRSKGGLLLDTREGLLAGGDSGAAIVPGDPRESLLIRAVRHQGDLAMPPREKLPDADIEALVEWIRQGAPDPRESEPAEGDEATPARGAIDLEAGREFWAFQPPKQVEPPQVDDEDWSADPVDRFLLAALRAEGLEPVAEADRTTWIRRVTFDLTGLPPTPEEVAAFVADEQPGAHVRVVDRLLESPAFGERWARHWLDVARYAESTGRTRNYPFREAWRYRDWVIDAIQSDKPYDRFIVEQIAGDLLPTEDPKSRDANRIATGLLAMGPKDLNERDREKYSFDNVDEQIDTVTRGFLALTVSCARCHDHKFDPVPTADYYAMAGIFRSTRDLSGYTNKGGGGNQLDPSLLVRLGEESARSADLAPEPANDRRARRQAQVQRQRQIAALEGQLGKVREQLQAFRKRQRDRQGKKPPKAERVRGRDLRQRVETLETRIEELRAAATPAPAKGKGKRGKRRGDEAERNSGVALAMGVLDASRPADCRIRLRGDHDKAGEPVARGALSVLPGGGPLEIPAGTSGRLQLAEWIASADNPLTARVLVNRVWHHLFGRGLVATVDNFGSTGERPSHPELLDWLAVDFAKNGWSVQRLIRRLVLTRAYRLSSAHHPGNWDKDPDDIRLWRMRPRRLEAEAIRDAMLAAAGLLETQRPTGSVVASLPANEVGRNGGALAGPFRHRSVYLPIVRNLEPEFLTTFDFPDPSMVAGRRDVTTVATQALYLLNSPFVVDAARALAERSKSDAGEDSEARLRRVWWLTLGREPTSDEIARAGAFLEADVARGGKGQLDPWSGLCQALFASAEFRYVN